METPATDVENDSDTPVSADSPMVIEGEAVEVTTEVPAPDASDSIETEAPEAETPSRETETSVPGAVHAATEARSAAPSVSPPPPPARGGSSFVGTVLGGLVAGVIGFAIAAYGAPRGWFGTSDAPGIDTSSFADAGEVQKLAADLDALRATPAADSGVSERLDAISAEIETLRAAAPDSSPAADLGPVQDAIAALDAKITGLEERIAALEGRPAGPDGSAAMEAQLEAFRSQLDTLAAEAKAEVEAARNRAAEVEAAAAAAAAKAERDAALAEIRAALDSGAPFATALERVPDAPETLASAAEGVATLLSLQVDFAGAARRALAVTQTVPEDATAGQRFTAFLRRQTNARSLTPREGADPDAVLSRAEAALSAGDLQAALTEIDALPEAARAAMSGWIDRARARSEAEKAVSGLSVATN